MLEIRIHSKAIWGRSDQVTIETRMAPWAPFKIVPITPGSSSACSSMSSVRPASLSRPTSSNAALQVRVDEDPDIVVDQFSPWRRIEGTFNDYHSIRQLAAKLTKDANNDLDNMEESLRPSLGFQRPRLGGAAHHQDAIDRRWQLHLRERVTPPHPANYSFERRADSPPHGVSLLCRLARVPSSTAGDVTAALIQLALGRCYVFEQL